jgi:flagellin
MTLKQPKKKERNMSSILTNNSAMNALQTMRNVTQGLNETQTRISTGLKIRSGKENAAYFSISNTMSGDSGMYKAINEGLTLTKNSLSTARLGAEKVVDLSKQFAERVAFAQGDTVDKAEVKKELSELANRVQTTVDQATFNGDNLVTSTTAVDVVTGVSRANGAFSTTTISFNKVDLSAIQTTLASVAGAISAGSDASAMQGFLSTVEGALNDAIDSATSLGVAEKSVETQKEFLTNLTDKIDSGTGAMVDANMEEEAARLQAFQVQQQLATQSLSIANQAPQNILSLFR